MRHSKVLDGICPKRLVLAEFGGLKPFGDAGVGSNDLQLDLHVPDKIRGNIGPIETIADSNLLQKNVKKCIKEVQSIHSRINSKQPRI